jgi:hypothetical protein
MGEDTCRELPDQPIRYYLPRIPGVVYTWGHKYISGWNDLHNVAVSPRARRRATRAQQIYTGTGDSGVQKNRTGEGDMIQEPATAPGRSMGRRTIGWISGMFIILLALIPAAAAGAPTVIVSNYTVTPAVLMPGDEGTITVVLTSTASMAPGSPLDLRVDTGGVNTSPITPDNAYIENVLLRSREIEVLSGSFQDVGEIGPGQSLPITFQVRAPGEEGIYFPEVWVSVRDATGVRYPVPVNVGSAYALAKKPSLRVERTVPASVDPGDSFGVTLTLYNDGEASANDISVGINASSDSIASTSPESYYIPVLRPGEEAALNLSFETDPGAPLGLLPVVATVDYRSADLAVFRQVETIGIPIVGRADMSVASIRTAPARITAGDPVGLTIRIENTGTADARSVRATIGGLSLSGTKEAFLGTIEPGNDGPAVFNLQAGEEGDYPYTLAIQYTDDYGAHTTEQALNLVVAGSDRVPALIIAVVAIVVVIAAALYWYRRRKEE